MPDTPTSPHTARYRDPDPAGRLHSEVFFRNSPPVIAALSPWLSGRSGRVLEIGAGTGQHAAAFSLAFPATEWWPSDPDPLHLTSIAAWQTALGTPRREPLALDAATVWAATPELRSICPLTAIVAMNVIHIAPLSVLKGIVAGAAQSLEPCGLLVLYGPFFVHGDPISAGNRTFDARLREENPEWGLRDIAEVEILGRKHGLEFAALSAMPANNRLLILRQPANSQERLGV